MKILIVALIISFTFLGRVTNDEDQGNNISPGLSKCTPLSKLPKKALSSCHEEPCVAKVGEYRVMNLEVIPGNCQKVTMRPKYSSALTGNMLLPATTMPIDLCNESTCKCPTKDGDVCAISRNESIPNLVAVKMNFTLQMAICCEQSNFFVYECSEPHTVTCMKLGLTLIPTPMHFGGGFPPFQFAPHNKNGPQPQPAGPPPQSAGAQPQGFPVGPPLFQPAPQAVQPAVRGFQGFQGFPGFPGFAAFPGFQGGSAAAKVQGGSAGAQAQGGSAGAQANPGQAPGAQAGFPGAAQG